MKKVTYARYMNFIFLLFLKNIIITEIEKLFGFVFFYIYLIELVLTIYPSTNLQKKFESKIN